MKKILLLWQQVHYNVYRFNVFTSINVFGLPITLLLKNKRVVNAYKKRGVENPGKLVRDVISDPRVSTVNWLTEGFMLLLGVMLVLSLFNILSVFLGFLVTRNWPKLLFVSVLGVPSVVINYFILWKGNKYLQYFKTFEKAPKNERRKWALVSLLVVLGVLCLLVFSFIFMDIEE